jgi:hypothetical protein
MKRFSIFVTRILNDYTFLLLFSVTSAFLIVSLCISFSVITSVSPNSAYGHITGNRTQQWTSPQQNVKIEFTYEPEKPLLDSPTELKFSVQNLQTGHHLKDLLAKIMVINGQGFFKFNNMTVQNGDFSENFTFPIEGTYQVILRINSKDYAIALASFKVIVPFQPIGTVDLNKTIPLILPATIIGIIGVMVVVTFLVIGNRKIKKESFHNDNEAANVC